MCIENWSIDLVIAIVVIQSIIGIWLAVSQRWYYKEWRKVCDLLAKKK